VVGHQTIGVQLAAVAAQAATELEKIELAVLVREEAGRAVVAALTHVHRDAGEHDAAAAWHARSTTHARRR
jgi:hypothetical protein